MLYAYNARVAQDMTVAEESKCSSRLLVKYLCALNISTMPAHVKLVLECSKSNGWTIEPWSKSLIVDDSSSLLFTFQYDVISRSFCSLPQSFDISRDQRFVLATLQSNFIPALLHLIYFFKRFDKFPVPDAPFPLLNFKPSLIRFLSNFAPLAFCH
mmetsp:Transcript_41430/g.130459  ORF Transcript_41430/g.130459 Transcript_41430/m.130459 type:complete len:156 (+) Transcript_41430:795-1262(+)